MSRQASYQNFSSPDGVFAAMPNGKSHQHRDPLWFLLGASVLTIVLSALPLAGLIVYPIRLFVTFIHEGGHALAAMLTLGQVESIYIYPNASGETYTRGGLQLFIASAGYLASTVFGAALLILGRHGKNAKPVLALNAGLILALTAFFAGNLFSWGTGIILTLGLISLAIWSTPRIAHFLLSFLAVQCCLNAFLDLRTLFLISATTNVHSDAAAMAQMTLIPATAWAVLWMVVSLIALVFALRGYTRHLRP
ncbi:MAG TPA: M50 family metallopeptidase [Blastocatellia bacterium]